MSSPTEQLRTAVRALVGRGPQRERLQHALAFTLRDLEPRALPGLARAEIQPVLRLLARGDEPLTRVLERLTDEEIDGHVRSILRAHDLLAGLVPV